jgi:hypothetical protein
MTVTEERARTPLRIFCSYAHEDYEFCQHLRKALSGLRTLGLVEDWSDGDLGPGREWDPKIRQQLDDADVIVFLVSYECCDSEYIMTYEYPRARERQKTQGAEIIPLVVTDVDYRGTPFAGLTPRVLVKGEPLAVALWPSPRTAFKEVAREIRELAEARAPADRPAVPSLPVGFWAPERREHVIGRQPLIDHLANTLQAHDRSSVALVGGGGVGKTTIALEYAWQHAQDYRLVTWLRAEDSTTLTADCVEMAKRVGVAATDRDEAKAAFRQWLATNSGWLIVFDNAVDHAAVRECLPDTIRGHVIVTSRERGWWEVAAEVPVDRLTPASAVTLLREVSGDDDAVAAAELADLLEGIPLALNDAGQAVREGGTSLRAYLDAIRPRLDRPPP